MPLSAKDLQLMRQAFAPDFEALKEHQKTVLLEAMEQHRETTHAVQDKRIDGLAKQVWMGSGVVGVAGWLMGFIKGSH